MSENGPKIRRISETSSVITQLLKQRETEEQVPFVGFMQDYQKLWNRLRSKSSQIKQLTAELANGVSVAPDHRSKVKEVQDELQELYK